MITKLPTRNDLGSLVKRGGICAEIGVWRGYFSVEILKWPIGKLFLVDAWVNQGEVYVDPLSEEDHEANLRETQHNIRGHLRGGRVEIVRGMSLDVAANNRTIPPLDFCYIDAAHDYDSVLKDLRAWAARMKTFGLLCGHDYTNNAQAKAWNFGVIEAVQTFCNETDWVLTHVTEEDFASFVLQRK